jgi:hypothetical protein
MVENVIISINTLSHFGDALLGKLAGFCLVLFFRSNKCMFPFMLILSI